MLFREWWRNSVLWGRGQQGLRSLGLVSVLGGGKTTREVLTNDLPHGFNCDGHDVLSFWPLILVTHLNLTIFFLKILCLSCERVDWLGFSRHVGARIFDRFMSLHLGGPLWNSPHIVTVWFTMIAYAGYPNCCSITNL